MKKENESTDFDYMGKPELPPSAEDMTRGMLSGLGLISNPTLSSREIIERLEGVVDLMSYDKTDKNWLGNEYAFAQKSSWEDAFMSLNKLIKDIKGE